MNKKQRKATRKEQVAEFKNKWNLEYPIIRYVASPLPKLKMKPLQVKPNKLAIEWNNVVPIQEDEMDGIAW